MGTYIQVNIYNQTLATLKLRGIDLATIMKTVGCPDTWISEVPIHAPPPPTPIKKTSPPASMMTSSSAAAATSSSSSPPPPLMKPFKSISAEICSIQPLQLDEALKSTENHQKPVSTALNDLFDEWDPLTSLTSSQQLKTPKEEEPDEEEEDQEMELQSIDLFQNLLTPAAADRLHQKSRRKLLSEDPEIGNSIYSIDCAYPGCGHKYNWKVKYGKLRLLDHALTHSNRRIPCKLCGFEATNVRRMRSHYAKHHPHERVQGYGMKALVSGGVAAADESDERELGELWLKCYQPWIKLIGEASGFMDGEKIRRVAKKRHGY